MTLPKPLPEFLVDHPDGEIRFVGSRISLETIARAFQEGYSAEMMVGLYPTLSLLQIYKAIVFYLENREAVDSLIDESDRICAEYRARAKPGPSMAELRRRMEALTQAKRGAASAR